jgi:hypothetical protein
MAHGSVEFGKHRIEIDCPHVENGACSDCIWPQIVPYIAARQTLDDLLPKFAKLSEALGAVAADVGRLAKATDAVRVWTEKAAATKWELGPASSGTTGEGTR